MSAFGSVVGSPLVGRDREVAELREVLTATASGSGGCVVLTGPAGIGKTRLLAEAQREAGLLSLATAAGGASEVDRVAPLTTLISVLRRGGPALVDAAALRDQPGGPLGLIDQAGAAIEAFASKRPLVVMIDDVQWADELSALALRLLVPQLSSSPVRWLLARRPVTATTPGHETVEWLIDNGAAQMRLGPLDSTSVRQLCANVLGAEPDPTVLTLAADGPGNPYLLVQWLDALRASGQILITAGAATIVGDDLPAGFVDAVNQRLRTLSPKAGRLLAAGSIFRRPFTLHGAARLLGLTVPDLLAAVDEVTTAGVLHDRDGQLAFAHDLMRQAVYQHLSGPVRMAMHREAAAVVREEGRSAVETAEHLIHGGTVRDQAAVEILRNAATEIAGRAPGMAATFVEHALSMLDEGDATRAELSAVAVGLLASAGRLTRARELGEAALDSGLGPAITARLLYGLAESFKHAGHNRAAVDYARRGLAPPGVPDGIRARLRSVEAHALLYVDDLPSADHAGAEADRLGRAVGDHAASVFGLTARSVVARADGRLDDALRFATSAVATADRARGDAMHRHPRIWLGAALAAVDRFADADSAFVIGRHEAESLGTAWSQPLWHFYHGSLLTAMGRLDDAEAEAEAGLDIAEQLTARQLSVPLLGLLIRIAVLRGELPQAHDHVRQMRRVLSGGVTTAPEDVTWTTALLQHADGLPRVALRTAAEIYDRLDDRLFLFTFDPGAVRDLVRIAIDADARAQAERVAAAARTLADRNPTVASFAGAAANAEGLVRRDRALLRTAVDRFRDSPRRLARAGAMEDAALADLSAGRRADAVRLFEEARDESADCGAMAAVHRIEARLRDAGARPRSGGTAGSPGTSAASATSGASGASAASAAHAELTPAEWPVAQRVARGMTNREIAADLRKSRHTVDAHLRHIFAKLGVNSRAAVATWVTAQEAA